MIELIRTRVGMMRATILQSLGVNSSHQDLCITFRVNSDTLRIQAVRVDLNGVVAIRAESTDQSNVAKRVLRNSRSNSHQLWLHTDRGFLVRGVQLGFREICLKSNIAPAFCQVDRRTYFWAVLTEDQVLPTVSGSTRISAPDVA